MGLRFRQDKNDYFKTYYIIKLFVIEPDVNTCETGRKTPIHWETRLLRFVVPLCYYRVPPPFQVLTLGSWRPFQIS